MFIVNKCQEAKFEFLADRLVGSQLARAKHRQNMDNEGLKAEIKEKPAISDLMIHYIIFVFYKLCNYSFFHAKCIGFVALKRAVY